MISDPNVYTFSYDDIMEEMLQDAENHTFGDVMQRFLERINSTLGWSGEIRFISSITVCFQLPYYDGNYSETGDKLYLAFSVYNDSSVGSVSFNTKLSGIASGIKMYMSVRTTYYSKSINGESSNVLFRNSNSYSFGYSRAFYLGKATPHTDFENLKILYERLPFIDGYRFQVFAIEWNNNNITASSEYLDTVDFFIVGKATHYRTGETVTAILNTVSPTELYLLINDSKCHMRIGLSNWQYIQGKTDSNEVYLIRFAVKGHIFDNCFLNGYISTRDYGTTYGGNRTLHEYLCTNISSDGYHGWYKGKISIDGEEYYGKLVFGSISDTSYWRLLFKKPKNN